jgi:hypothetical protein
MTATTAAMIVLSSRRQKIVPANKNKNYEQIEDCSCKQEQNYEQIEDCSCKQEQKL